MKKLTFLACLLSLPIFLLSQNSMEVQDAATPPISPEVIANLFPGQGVEIVDWTFVGEPSAIGVFTDGNDAVGIDHGILLTTGSATDVDGMGSTFASTSLMLPGDSDLDALTQAPTFDAQVLTVTFVPMGDTMIFKYAFASEEYPEYAGSAFNDVFGFFVSGPGIVGPYSNNAVNIALIPGTTEPVAINSVNHVTNNQFYTDNFYFNDGNQQPVYDGIIDVFSAMLPVTPLETYTLKLAIGDAGDNIYDSAVFLEAESFTGSGDTLASNVSQFLFNPLAEGAASSTATFDFSDFGPWTFPWSATVSGTAEQGVDFEITGLPASIVQANPVVNAMMEILQDAENEGVEYFKIEFESQGGFKFPYYFYLDDSIAAPVLPDTATCSGGAVVLSAVVASQAEEYFFENDTPLEIDPVDVAVYSEIEVSGVPVDVLTDASFVESVCLNLEINWVNDIDLHLVAPNGKVLKLSTDNGGDCDDYANTCFSPSASQKISEVLPPGYDCTGGEQAPFTGSFLPESGWEEIEGTPVNGTWSLVVLDDAMGFSGTLLDWSITFNSGGIFGEPSYEWSTGETTPEISVSPIETTTYTVTVTQNGLTLTDEATIAINGNIGTSEITGTYCNDPGFSLVVNGTVYDFNNPVGMEIFPGASYTGCDSIVNVNLIFEQTDSTFISMLICSGDCVDIGGQTLCDPGLHEINLTGYEGCDSLLIVELTPLQLELFNLNIESSCDLTTYTVSFEIMGGDPATYAVSPPGSGTLSGNFFTSNPITCGNGFVFTVSDASGCDPVVVSQNEIICECASQAGAMFVSPIEICGPGEVTAGYNTSSQILDCNDVVSFILHPGLLSAPIAISSEPTFDLTGLNAGQTYYITAAVGNDDGTGMVDMNDPCLDYSAGVGVTYFDVPTADFIGSSFEICQGENIDLQVELTGEGPWELAYQVGTTLFIVPMIEESPFTVSLTAMETGEITLLSVSDANCPGVLGGSVITVNPAPTGTIFSDTTVCPGNEAQVQLEFFGEAPFEVGLIVNGQFESFPVAANNLELNFVVDEETEVTLLSVTDASGCTSSPMETVTLETYPPPVAEASFNGPLCPFFDLELSGNGGEEYLWTGPMGFASEEQNPMVPEISPGFGGEYVLQVTDVCELTDTFSLQVEFDCMMFTDTIFVGESGEPLCFDEILTDADLCNPLVALDAQIDGGCLTYTGTAEDADMMCLQVVLNGDTMAVQVIVSVFNPSSTAQSTVESVLTVFPNPAEDYLQADWQNMEVSSAELLDPFGRRVHVFENPKQGFLLSIEDLAQGTYLFRFQTPAGVLTRKVVIVR